jgi:hypothetical protein
VTKVYWKKGLWKTNGYVAFIIEWKPMFVASIIEGMPMIMLISYWIKPMCGCFLGKEKGRSYCYVAFIVRCYKPMFVGSIIEWKWNVAYFHWWTRVIVMLLSLLDGSQCL